MQTVEQPDVWQAPGANSTPGMQVMTPAARVARALDSAQRVRQDPMHAHACCGPPRAMGHRRAVTNRKSQSTRAGPPRSRRSGLG